MASLLGMGILQFIGNVWYLTMFILWQLQYLGMQAMWLLVMALSSALRRKKRSTDDQSEFKETSFYS